jgi:hypothetical protein
MWEFFERQFSFLSLLVHSASSDCGKAHTITKEQYQIFGLVLIDLLTQQVVQSALSFRVPIFICTFKLSQMCLFLFWRGNIAMMLFYEIPKKLMKRLN